MKDEEIDAELDLGKAQKEEKKIKENIKKSAEKEPEEFNPESKKEKSYQKNFLIILGVIVSIFVLIFAIYMIIGEKRTYTIEELHEMNLQGKLDESEGYIYNGFSFVKYNNQWWTYFRRANTEENYNVQMRYSPKEVEDIPLMGDYIYFLQFNSTYITFDPTAQNLSYTALAAADVSQALSKVFEIAPVPACTKNETGACLQLQIVPECPPGVPTIKFVVDEKPGVIAKGNCITIQGQGFDLVKAVDRLLFSWYGIMS